MTATPRANTLRPSDPASRVERMVRCAGLIRRARPGPDGVRRRWAIPGRTAATTPFRPRSRDHPPPDRTDLAAPERRCRGAGPSTLLRRAPPGRRTTTRPDLPAAARGAPNGTGIGRSALGATASTPARRRPAPTTKQDRAVDTAARAGPARTVRGPTPTPAPIDRPGAGLRAGDTARRPRRRAAPHVAVSRTDPGPGRGTVTRPATATGTGRRRRSAVGCGWPSRRSWCPARWPRSWAWCCCGREVGDRHRWAPSSRCGAPSSRPGLPTAHREAVMRHAPDC